MTQQLPDIAALCERYGVAHLEVFGSAAGTELADALEALLVTRQGSSLRSAGVETSSMCRNAGASFSISGTGTPKLSK